MLSALMFMSRVLMQMIPNIHLLGLFIASTTVAFRLKALIPLYLYVLIEGLFTGFALWWVPYLYVWIPLWGAFMLLGRLNIPKKAQTPIYMLVCGLHGLLFGVLYAPMQAILFGLSLQGMIAWIIAGIPFDIIHAIGNAASGVLIVTLSTLLKKLNANQIK